MRRKGLLETLAAAARLAFYVWLIAVVATLPVFFVVSRTPDYWTGLAAFGFVVGAIMETWAVLLVPPLLCWIALLLLLDRTALSKSWLQHVLLSALAGLLGCAAYYLLYLLLRSGTDGVSNGYLAFGIFVPMACIVLFPIFALVFKRYHGWLKLSAFFAEDARS